MRCSVLNRSQQELQCLTVSILSKLSWPCKERIDPGTWSWDFNSVLTHFCQLCSSAAKQWSLNLPDLLDLTFLVVRHSLSVSHAVCVYVKLIGNSFCINSHPAFLISLQPVMNQRPLKLGVLRDLEESSSPYHVPTIRPKVISDRKT